jgi:hypothetical protein
MAASCSGLGDEFCAIIMATGSPGMRWISMQTRKLEISNVTSAARRRRIMKRVIQTYLCCSR